MTTQKALEVMQLSKNIAEDMPVDVQFAITIQHGEVSLLSEEWNTDKSINIGIVKAYRATKRGLDMRIAECLLPHAEEITTTSWSMSPW
jgi:hypothetical protein